MGLNDFSFPGPILTSQAPSLHKLLLAPDITRMGPSMAPWMKMSDWKPHRSQGWFHTGRHIAERLRASMEGRTLQFCLT